MIKTSIRQYEEAGAAEKQIRAIENRKMVQIENAASEGSVNSSMIKNLISKANNTKQNQFHTEAATGGVL